MAVDRQRSGEIGSAATNICNNRTAGSDVFYEVRSKDI
jgi:hypothetical protein